jgi:hypothetical protein
MMGHRQVEQAALFYEFSLERHVPADHLLRSVDRFVELGALRREPAYSATNSMRRRVNLRETSQPCDAIIAVGRCLGKEID